VPTPLAGTIHHVHDFPDSRSRRVARRGHRQRGMCGSASGRPLM